MNALALIKTWWPTALPVLVTIAFGINGWWSGHKATIAERQHGEITQLKAETAALRRDAATQESINEIARNIPSAADTARSLRDGTF